MEERTCNNCGYTGPDLIRVFDYATRRSMCNKCVWEDAPHVAAVADKIGQHFAAGTLANYPLEERLRDLRCGEEADPILSAEEKADAHLNFLRHHGGRNRCEN